jgi:outer membrane immunogenic protein
MRRFAMAALAAFFALCAHVDAADLGGKGPRIAASAPVEAQEQAWHRSALYVGAVAGYNIAVLEAEGIDLANGKLMGGGVVGYRHRLPQYVLGVEGDWVFTDISASSTVSGVTVSAANRHLASVRLVAGIPLGPVLFYGTAGPAWQHARVKATDGVDSDTDRVWQLGWSAGAGIEVELTKSFAVRVEALHYRFNKDNSPFDAFETEQTVARGGLVFKF